MAIYDKRFGLQQSMVDYLNQALPDISDISNISNISKPTTPGPDIPTPISVAPEPGLTPEQLALLYPQNVGGGEGFDTDIPFQNRTGAFGNLDKTRTKTVVRDVYDEELGDFIATELTGYYNPKLGNFQTFEGKNLTPAFSNTGMRPGIVDLGLNLLGIENKTIGGYVPGSIRGIYDTPMNLFRRERNEPPGLTPQQKMGLASMSKVYQDIGRTRDRDSDTGVVNVQATKDAIERSRRKSAIAQEAANREAARNRGRDDRPNRGGSQTQRDAGPGFSGSGSAAEMGSF